MIGIISDIHGNYVALAAALELLDQRGVSEIICLGDVAGYYCQVNECCETLRSRNIFTLMGNHDWYLTAGEACPRSYSANICLDYQRRIITQDNLSWLGSLPREATLHDIRMVHGGWNNLVDEYITPSRDYFARLTGLLFASGHTHIQCLWTQDRKYYCNPGSIGQPRDGDPRAAFAIWDGQSFYLHRIEYDIFRIQHKMSEAGLDPCYASCLLSGTRIGEHVRCNPAKYIVSHKGNGIND